MTSLIAGVGAPNSVGPVSGGKVYAYNAITNVSNTTVAAANPQRQSITFHNPGTNDIFISQTTIQTSGSDVAFVPTTSDLGGTFRVYANGGSLTITGECQKAWQALAAADTTNPLTVMESNG